VSQQTALRKIMGAPKPPPLNPDGTRPGPFDEIIKQFRRPPAEPANGSGKGDGARGKRQPAAVSSGAKGSASKQPAEPKQREARDPNAKPPPPPRKRQKKRSGRRR
jgi:hypothetical protein